MAGPKWKHDGVRVIPGHSLDPNTAQTPGMDRKAAINLARAVNDKRSIKLRRKRAGWDPQYLATILGHLPR